MVNHMVMINHMVENIFGKTIWLTIYGSRPTWFKVKVRSQ